MREPVGEAGLRARRHRHRQELLEEAHAAAHQVVVGAAVVPPAGDEWLEGVQTREEQQPHRLQQPFGSGRAAVAVGIGIGIGIGETANQIGRQHRASLDPPRS